jgi:hypothetical protein
MVNYKWLEEVVAYLKDISRLETLHMLVIFVAAYCNVFMLFENVPVVVRRMDHLS